MEFKQFSSSDIPELITYIHSLKTGLRDEDLDYLRGDIAVWGYRITSETGNPDNRFEELTQDILGLNLIDLLEGKHNLVIVTTSPEHQLLVKELTAVGAIVNHLQQYGEVTFDFGTKEGLGTEVEVLIIRSM